MPIPTRSQSMRVGAANTNSEPQQTYISSGRGYRRAAETKDSLSATTKTKADVSTPEAASTPLPVAVLAPAVVPEPSHDVRPSDRATTSIPRSRPMSAVISKKPTLLPSRPQGEPVKSHGRNSSTSTQHLGHARMRSDVRPASGSTKTASSNTHHVSATRPAFNAYQQHYTPQKQRRTPDLQVANNDQNSTDAAGVVPSGLTRLQDELLQLSLVYENSGKNLKGYEASFKQKLGNEIRRLRKENASVSLLEQNHQDQLNTAAIEAWLNTEDSGLGNNRVQILSDCVQQLSELSLAEGPFETIMREFDRWQENVSASTGRFYLTDQGPANHIIRPINPGGASFISPLGREWSEQVCELQSRVQLCQRLLEYLGDPAGSSGLGMVLAEHRHLAELMIKEVDACQAIYRVVMKQQQDWTASLLAKAISEVQAHEDDSNPVSRMGIWETLQDP